MTNNLSILKIESSDGILLSTRHASQEITPITKGKVTRTIGHSPLVSRSTSPAKLRCIVETGEPPDAHLLKIHNQFTIYSIVKFRGGKSQASPPNCVNDLVEDHVDHIIFRPILNVFLIDFSCKCNNSISETWRLEFEEQ
jgi:hypothetical protein